MVKLTKQELKRRRVSTSVQLHEGTTLGELCNQLGPDAQFCISHGHYDEREYEFYESRFETDEEYNQRIKDLIERKEEAAAETLRIANEKRVKREEKERREYLRLKKKFEGK